MKGKKCTKCHVFKPIDCFHSGSYINRDGIRNSRRECKECTHAQNMKWKTKNRKLVNKQSKETRKRRGRFRSALMRSRLMAKKSGFVACSASGNEIESAFNGRCAMCGLEESKHNGLLHMDHDHATGMFRGWLCRTCNQGIGLLKDSPELLKKAISYLNGE